MVELQEGKFNFFYTHEIPPTKDEYFYSVEEAIEKFQYKEKRLLQMDNYLWKLEEKSDLAVMSEDSESIAAKINIFSLHNNKTMKEIHSLAVKHKVVTYYSSMIVLVEQFQHEMLDRMEKRDDMFDRPQADLKKSFVDYSSSSQITYNISLSFVLLFSVLLTLK